MLLSVTQTISKVKQPRGGYLPIKLFEIIELPINEELHLDENINAGLIGTAVDYLTRFILSNDSQNAFCISLLGSKKINQSDIAATLLSQIKGLDDTSITNAIKLTGYDVCYRAGILGFKPIDEINPDINTINNVRILVNRSLEFFNSYGPIISDGFTFEPNGYTLMVASGDGDFLTTDTLWDFKVIKGEPTAKHTLQLLMYYIMGKHSGNSIFDGIRKIGIFNPRLNKVYIYDMSKINPEIIKDIEDNVICY